MIPINHLKNFLGNLYQKYYKNQNLQITMMKPKDLNDAQMVVEYLQNEIPVVVNFEDVEEIKVKQITDFISGKVRVLNGNVEQVGQKIFLFTPNDIAVENSSKK